MMRDLRLAARRLLRSPLYTAFALASLAVGVTLTTAVYAVLNATLWQRPPLADTDRLMTLTASGSFVPSRSVSFADMKVYLATQQSLATSAFALTRGDYVPIAGGSAAVTTMPVSGAYFQVLGVQPLHGRVLGPDDDRPSATPAVLLGYRVWRSTFGADPGVVGTTVRLGDRPHVVVGVLPRGFQGLDIGGPDRSSVWLSVSAAEAMATPATTAAQRDARTVSVVGRLAPGVTLARAAAEAEAIGAQLDRDAPLSQQVEPGRPAQVAARRWSLNSHARIQAEAVGRASLTAYLLIAVAGLVLVVACSNLANLSLARGSARQHEFAIRRALGASRSQLVRELLSESVLIAILGAGASILLMRVVFWLCTVDLPVVNQNVVSLAPEIDMRVLIFAAGALLLSLLVFGLQPAFQLTRESMRSELAAGATSVVPGLRRHWRLIRWQVAVAFTLMILASVAVRYSVLLSRDDSGIDLDRLAIATAVYLPQRVPEIEARAVIDRVLTSLRLAPGVERAAAATGMPFGISTTPLVTLASPERPTVAPDSVFSIAATPEIFETLGIKILRGRGLDPRDVAGGPAVVVLSAATARALFGDEDAVGRQVTLTTTTFTKERTPNKIVTAAAVVGIAADTDVQSRGERRPGLLYLPLTQTFSPGITYVVRTTDPEAAARAIQIAAAREHATAPVSGAGPAAVMLAPALLLTRIATGVTLILGLVALALSMVGLHGVLAHVLASRTREMALRLILGAGRADVRRLAIWQGVRPVLGGLVFGLVVGLLLRLALIRLFRLRIELLDPMAVILVPAIFVAIAVVACAWPAWRAGRVDPNVALRDA